MIRVSSTGYMYICNMEAKYIKGATCSLSRQDHKLQRLEHTWQLDHGSLEHEQLSQCFKGQEEGIGEGKKDSRESY